MAYPYAVTGTNQTMTQAAPKAPKPLPTWDNQVQNVPLASQQNATAQGNEQVLQTAQQKSMGGFQSPTMDTVVQQTQNLLKDPSMGKDYAGEKQLALEQQNRNMNQQLETLRQQTAPTSYTGQNLRNLTNVALQAVQQRADTGRQIDIEQNKAQREAMLQALTQGQNVAQQERGMFDQDIQNLLATRGAYEGEANRAQQNSVLDKTFLQDMEKMRSTQDWQGVQSALDRELQKATSEGNWANARELEAMRGKFEIERLASQQDFQGAQAEIDRQLQKALTEGNWQNAKELEQIRGTFDIQKLVSQQDFQGAQSALDRELEKALTEGNWQNAVELTQMKGEIDKQMQIAQQEFAKSERIATQGWQSSERISSQDFETTLKNLEIQAQKAMQAGDFEQAKYLQEQDAMVRLKMQTQEYNQQEKMAYLGQQLEEARANNDVDRQKQILTFQHSQEMETILQQQGFQSAQEYANQQFQLAMQSNDFAQAQALQETQLKFQAAEAVKDRALEEARVALQARGLDMQQVEQRYNIINQEIEAGRAAPDAALNYLNSQLAGSGITLTPVDAEQARKEALDSEYAGQLYQFGLTHPEYIDQTTGEINEEGRKAFNSFYNMVIYGAKGAPSAGTTTNVTSPSSTGTSWTNPTITTNSTNNITQGSSNYGTTNINTGTNTGGSIVLPYGVGTVRY